MDAEEIGEYPEGTEFDLVARTARSYPQLGTYWKSLKLACQATGLWPNDKALHKSLKIKQGRVEPIFDMKGNVAGMVPDSTSFENMPHKEFCIYMDAAMADLAEAIGYDPLQWWIDLKAKDDRR